MNNKQRPIYLCSFMRERKEHIQKEGSFVGHEHGKWNGNTIIWPKNIDSETINPKNFIKLKKELNLNEVLLIGRLSGTRGIVSISNHINRSGQNFLRGKTPEEEFPQFPDMSKIYNKKNGLKPAIVHTIGSKRFKNISSNENVIWSESIGLIAPVAHYVGIKVFAIGINNFSDINKIL